MNTQKDVRAIDPQVADLIAGETRRQHAGLEMIASENFVSEAVLETMGSVFTNKYAEGYPGRRYYGGCEHCDGVETLAIERAKKLFGAEHANVQPHSGAQANMAAYMALLKPGDSFLGMRLAHGGHLTHGHPVNFSGKLFHVVDYGVRREDERIDYDALEEIAHREHPRLIVCGASAYPRVIEFERIGRIAASVGAVSMADIAHIAGPVAAGLHPNPFPHIDIVTSTTHKTLRGPRGGLILCKSAFAKDIDREVFPGTQGGPLMHIIAAKAVCLQEALQETFVRYQQRILRNAAILAEVLLQEGLRLVSGGTDNHLLLVDVSPLGMTGKAAEQSLEAARITVNKNAIPFDPNPPMTTSGIRIGSPALTTRGMGEDEFRRIGRLIARVLRNPQDESVRSDVKEEVSQMAEAFPLYSTRLADCPER